MRKSQILHPHANACPEQRRRALRSLPSAFLSILFFILHSLFFIRHSYALNIGDIYPLANAIGNRTLGNYITPLLRASIVGAGVIAFLIFLGGGVMIIANAGNPKQVESGKNAITAGITGLVLVITAYWIIQIVEVLTGLDLLNPGI